MGIDFTSFLNKMSKETGNGTGDLPKQIKQPVKETIKEKQPVKETIKEKQPVKETKQEVVENKENLYEEYVENGLSYATAFIKSIRKNFNNKEERNIILESVRKAIDLYLGDIPRIQPQIKETKTVPPVKTIQPTINEENTYHRDVNIECKINAFGQPEVDLSKMTNQDINDIKVLSGII